MKKLRMMTITKILLMVSVSLLLSFMSCTGKQGQSAVQKETLIAEDRSDPPDMDIFSAALFGNVQVIEQHIKAGTDLDAKDDYGSTPLIITATFGKTEAAAALIKGGADVNIRNRDGATALHSAAFLCYPEIVELLLKNGADPLIRNNFGSTALESVESPFEEVRIIYDQFSRDLGPLGLKLDYQYIEKTRPVIAERLRSAGS